MCMAGEPVSELEPVGARCFWLLRAGAAWNKTEEQEPIPLGKKVKAKAAKKWAGSSALLEDKKHKKIV